MSRSYYDVVTRISEDYAQLFAYQGSRTDKHVREHEIYELVAPGAEAHELTRRRNHARRPGEDTLTSATQPGAPLLRRPPSGIRLHRRLDPGAECCRAALHCLAAVGTAAWTRLRRRGGSPSRCGRPPRRSPRRASRRAAAEPPAPVAGAIPRPLPRRAPSAARSPTAARPRQASSPSSRSRAGHAREEPAPARLADSPPSRSRRERAQVRTR